MKKLDLSSIKKLDKSNMLGLILDFGKLSKEGYDNGLKFSATNRGGSANLDGGKNTINIEQIKNIVFCGLGGSAQGADLIRSFLSNEAKMPLVVDRIIRFLNL